MEKTEEEVKLIKIIRYDRRRQTTDDRRQINLRSNTHGCELIITSIYCLPIYCHYAQSSNPDFNVYIFTAIGHVSCLPDT